MVALADKPSIAKARAFEKVVNRRAHLRLRLIPGEIGSQPEAALELTDLCLRKRVRLTKFNRWYDPRIGRWISEDPIGFAAGDANLYRYVGNASPVATDASGTSITVITNHESAGGFGHTGVIVGDISTGYTYYSYEHDRDRSKGFDTFQDAWDYAQGVGYDSYYGYYTTPEEDAAAKDEMVRQKQNRYRFFRNNCEDAAMAVVNAGGQDTKNCLTRMALELS